ncbi:T-complex protein 1 subunit gamma [Chytriomyces hyalinus]|nr:T-complex protein 1 subunit gamma [Chytriomyces hyalinus]
MLEKILVASFVSAVALAQTCTPTVGTDAYCGFLAPIDTAFAAGTGANSSLASLNQFMPLLSACPGLNITLTPLLYCLGGIGPCTNATWSLPSNPANIKEDAAFFNNAKFADSLPALRAAGVKPVCLEACQTMSKPILSCPALKLIGVTGQNDPCAGLPSTDCVSLPGDASGKFTLWTAPGASAAAPSAGGAAASASASPAAATSSKSSAEGVAVNAAALLVAVAAAQNSAKMMQQPVIVMNTNMERETGRKAQMSNINAAKTVADIIRTCLGPRAMLKMLLDPMGGIVLTNDGNAILREVEVAHPAAKSMIELSRTQDEEVGDGTTSVIILAGEVLSSALPFLERQIHPITIISAYKKALEDALQFSNQFAVPVNTENKEEMLRLIKSSIGTKMVSQWSELMCSLAYDAVKCVRVELESSAGSDKKVEVDIKRYARVEKVPGGEIEESCVLDGIMINKDVTHPKMRRRIENPRVVLLDCPLEYKKGESQTNVEVTDEAHWARLLEIEEEQVKELCDHIIKVKPDLVFTEKGVSDLAQHYFNKAGITAIRRIRKTDNHRVARATGATILNRVEDLKEEDVGTKCGLFEVRKIGDEYFTYLVQCQDPKACTILLRGPSKDVLQEIDRNLQDAMCVARNVMFEPKLCPGGGATEMALSVLLSEKAKSLSGVEQWPYKAVAEALEVIPRTLVQNCGGNAIKTLTQLRAKHAEGHHSWGINGTTGTIVDMKEYGVWEPQAVKTQTIKTAIESACLLLRVDDIVSGLSRKKETGGGQQAAADGGEPEEGDPREG